MKFKITSLIVIFLFVSMSLLAQITAESVGYRYQKLVFESDTAHILIKSQKGEEALRKPILFEVQGSSAVPLIVHNGEQLVSYVSLTEGFVEEDYHLILVNKPGLPLICHEEKLTKGKYKDQNTGKYPEAYLKNNNLEYYLRRNKVIIDYLKIQSWVDSSKIVVVGHSEGSTIATHMADKIPGISHLIYSGGLPYFPRILAMIQKERKMEDNEANPWVEKSYDYWEDVIEHPDSLYRNEGWNTNYGTFSFSQSENEVLKGLRIPILISFGTKDEAAPYNDMFHVETIKDKCENITFKAWLGLDHYYQHAGPNSLDPGSGDYLPTVVKSWLDWLK